MSYGNNKKLARCLLCMNRTGPWSGRSIQTKAKEHIMTSKYNPYEEVRKSKADSAADDWRETSSRFWRYLRTRPLESWGFFIAGLVFGGLFF